MEDKILKAFNTPRDKNRIDKFLHLLGIIWHANPDLRFGQLINVLGLYGFYKEDDVAYGDMLRFYSEYIANPLDID